MKHPVKSVYRDKAEELSRQLTKAGVPHEKCRTMDGYTIFYPDSGKRVGSAEMDSVSPSAGKLLWDLRGFGLEGSRSAETEEAAEIFKKQYERDIREELLNVRDQKGKS